MPPVNVAATAGVIAVSVAVAAAVAIYESPELQRMASDLRRRIAIALHQFGDTISPEDRANLFNRPEDAEGFLESCGLGRGSLPPDVDADPDALRRQREELMYWNAIRESKKEKEQEDEKLSEKRPRRSRASSSFDDFLQQDQSEKGAFVFHQSGHEAHNNEGVIRRRGTEGLRGLSHSLYTNPFADEHGIEDDIAFENNLMDPEKDELLSDIYSATDMGDRRLPKTDDATSSRENAPQAADPSLDALANALQSVFEAEDTPQTHSASETEGRESSERELGADEYMTAGQDPQDQSVYASIQSWAQGASHNASFYSPLPESTASSEGELVSEAGFVTPTDSVSVAGSGVDVHGDTESTMSYGVMSDDEGILTPRSWTEVGSVVSESEAGREAVHA
ncbi:hypothetical protein GGS20DRAFT_544739 [Poronia punctata]|nr:hypothetical protein GGS20DRAFT_544739 [Poronia punctata]